MPYIEEKDRIAVLTHGPNTPGELNFFLTKMILRYLPDKPSYSKYNEVIGVLECVQLELYRRVVAKYEDSKKELNGDVYE